MERASVCMLGSLEGGVCQFRLIYNFKSIIVEIKEASNLDIDRFFFLPIVYGQYLNVPE